MKKHKQVELSITDCVKFWEDYHHLKDILKALEVMKVGEKYELWFERKDGAIELKIEKVS